MKFIDEVTIEVASGKGGAGHVSFRREMFVPRGGPDGGEGGRGGDVIFETSTRAHSLLDLKIKTKYRAEDGEPGKNQNRSGAAGKDLIIIVPPGTIIKDMNGHTIKDLRQDEVYIFLKGGIGGKGNPFYKTSINQAPAVAQKGMPGANAKIHLELKLLADVGIIGFPNAGKSTLISHISSARPKVADYPFTTLIPNLGVVRFGDEKNFVVADMPGLIKGAHRGVGLGTRFLKHIERTKCFVHMIDASGMSERDPLQDYKDINYELKMYDRAHEEIEDYSPLSTRTQIVVLNKIDVLGPEERARLIKTFQSINNKIIMVSAVTGENIKELVNEMGKMVFYVEDESKEIKNEAKARYQIQKRVSKEAGKKESGKAKGLSKKKITTRKKNSTQKSKKVGSKKVNTKEKAADKKTGTKRKGTKVKRSKK